MCLKSLRPQVYPQSPSWPAPRTVGLKQHMAVQPHLWEGPLALSASDCHRKCRFAERPLGMYIMGGFLVKSWISS